MPFWGSRATFTSFAFNPGFFATSLYVSAAVNARAAATHKPRVPSTRTDDAAESLGAADATTDVSAAATVFTNLTLSESAPSGEGNLQTSVTPEVDSDAVVASTEST